MKKKKYVLCPGYIVSKNDGQEHKISAAALAYLYRVPLSECFIQSIDGPRGNYPRGLLHLFPRYNGDYDLSKGFRMDKGDD